MVSYQEKNRLRKMEEAKDKTTMGLEVDPPSSVQPNDEPENSKKRGRPKKEKNDDSSDDE